MGLARGQAVGSALSDYPHDYGDKETRALLPKRFLLWYHTVTTKSHP